MSDTRKELREATNLPRAYRADTTECDQLDASTRRLAALADEGLARRTAAGAIT